MRSIKTLAVLAIFFAQNAMTQTAESASQIAYSLIATDLHDLYIANADGSSPKRVTNFAGGNGYSAWSPDGKRIAFYAKYDEKKTWSIHTINSDGTQRKRHTHEYGYWDNAPAWSPDGSQIAFARAFTDAEGVRHHQIWIMNEDGSEQKQINGLSGGGPYFTRDGQIVYHSQPGPSEIFIANADGSNLRQLTNNEAEDWHPEVSPDGTQIAFMSDRDGNNEIYVMNLDGSDQKRLTFSQDEMDWYPSWSPDAKELLVSSNKNGERRVYRMKADGSDKRTVAKNGSQAAWFKARIHSDEDPFLGQKRPGITAIPFAPGAISTKGWVLGSEFGLDTKEFYMINPNQGGYGAQVVVFSKQGREWKQHNFMQVHSTDSNRLYWKNKYIERTATGWSKMKSIGPQFEREDWGIMRVTASRQGTYVFDDYKSNDVIRISRVVDGVRQTPELLGPEINVGTWTAHPVIAPDESYLIWDSEREGGHGDSDIYVTFRQPNGSWGKAINLGDKVNSEHADFSSWITPDGQYLFFWRSVQMTNPDGSTYNVGGKYWVSTQVIENLRPRKSAIMVKTLNIANLFLLLVAAFLLNACQPGTKAAKAHEPLGEEGLYFGQEPPGSNPVDLIPEAFNPEGYAIMTGFRPGVREFYFNKVDDSPFGPEVVVFRKEGRDWKEYKFPATGSDTLYFRDKYIERTATGWSEVKSLGPLFEDFRIMRLTASRKGMLVFDEATRDGSGVLRYSRLVNGKWEAPLPLSDNINIGKWSAHPFIAPDESYIIWDAEIEGGHGDNDMYISFRQQDGSWGPAINFGESINTEAEDGGGHVTPDGKYLTFCPRCDPPFDKKWMDAEIIERLRSQNQP